MFYKNYDFGIVCNNVSCRNAGFDKLVVANVRLEMVGNVLVVQFVDLVCSAYRSWRRNLFTCIVATAGARRRSRDKAGYNRFRHAVAHRTMY